MDLSTNKEIALNLSKAIMAGNWELVDEILDENFQYYADGNPALNKNQYVFFMKEILSNGFSEMDMKFNHIIAEGTKVAIDYTNEMTHTGIFFNVAATGKRILATGQFIREIKNGKIINEWQTTNKFGLMQQLGLLG